MYEQKKGAFGKPGESEGTSKRESEDAAAAGAPHLTETGA